MSDYQSALDIFNQTVANLSFFADSQKAYALGEIQTYQSQSGDPDMGAYNMTMYGFDSVSTAKDNVMNSIGNVSNYFIHPDQLNSIPVNNSTTVTAFQTDHTSISSAITSQAANIITPIVNDPTIILPTHDPRIMILWGAFALLLVKFVLFTRR